MEGMKMGTNMALATFVQATKAHGCLKENTQDMFQ
jgi:hypothetical protein